MKEEAQFETLAKIVQRKVEPEPPQLVNWGHQSWGGSPVTMTTTASPSISYYANTITTGGV